MKSNSTKKLAPATAHSTPARASFFVEPLFIKITPLHRKNRREKTADNRQRLPLAWQGRGRNPSPAGNFGRGSLAPSHAGTRLPIAVRGGPASQTARAQGAPPRPAPGFPGRLLDSVPHAPLSKEVKKQRIPGWASAWSVLCKLPTVALPTSGQESVRHFPVSVLTAHFPP